MRVITQAIASSSGWSTIDAGWTACRAAPRVSRHEPSRSVRATCAGTLRPAAPRPARSRQARSGRANSGSTGSTASTKISACRSVMRAPARRVEHGRVPFHERLAPGHHRGGFVLGDPQRRRDLQPHRTLHHSSEHPAAASGIYQRLPAEHVHTDQPLRSLHGDHVGDLDQMVQRVGGVECRPCTCLVDLRRLVAPHTAPVERGPCIVRTLRLGSKAGLHHHASRLEQTYDIQWLATLRQVCSENGSAGSQAMVKSSHARRPQWLRRRLEAMADAACWVRRPVGRPHYRAGSDFESALTAVTGGVHAVRVTAPAEAAPRPKTRSRSHSPAPVTSAPCCPCTAWHRLRRPGPCLFREPRTRSWRTSAWRERWHPPSARAPPD